MAACIMTLEETYVLVIHDTTVTVWQPPSSGQCFIHDSGTTVATISKTKISNQITQYDIKSPEDETACNCLQFVCINTGLSETAGSTLLVYLLSS
jgi:hypothetical protein